MGQQFVAVAVPKQCLVGMAFASRGAAVPEVVDLLVVDPRDLVVGCLDLLCQPLLIGMGDEQDLMTVEGQIGSRGLLTLPSGCVNFVRTTSPRDSFS
jgi:hypothetical protein